MAVPDVTYTVEIAFNSDWKTPSGSRVWTDVSAYVELQEGINISVGRSDEFSTADANELTLTLDNKDGRFTWGNTSSPYYPNIKLGKPIRVTATMAGNPASTRFLGFIDEWPVEWPGDTAGFAQATISAKSRIAWIGVTAPTLHPTDQEIASWGLDYYWPLTDAADVETATETSNRAPLTVVGDTTFQYALNTNPGWQDGRPGVLLRGVTTNKPDGRLTGVLPTPKQLQTSAGTGFSIGVFAQAISNSGSPTTPILSLLDASGANGIRVGLTSTTLTVGGSVYTVANPALSFLGSGTTHVVVTIEPIGGGDNVMSVYFNGSLAGTATANTATTIDLSAITLQSIQEWSGVYADVAFGRLAVWNAVLTAAAAFEITWTAKIGSQEWTHERLARLARWSGIPSAEALASFSDVTMSAIDAEGTQILELMRQVETAEGGFLFDEPGGALRLQPRSYRYKQAGTSLAFTTDRVGGYVPKLDRSGLANVGVGKGPNDLEVVYANESSRSAYGDAGYEVETTSIFPRDDTLQQVAWRVNGNSEPRPRVTAVRFSVLDWVGTTAFPLQALAPGSKIVLTGGPAQAPNSASASFFVEGYTEEIGVGAWDISPNLSPVVLEDLVLVLDSATAGLLDTNVLAF